MITSDQEQQVKLQFLEEATDYLDAIESGLLGLGSGAVAGKELDALLRAAHSIKGGAAMMGYTTLSGLGHKLEDYFKIVQYGRADKPDVEIEQLLLSTIDRLRQIVDFNRQGRDADPDWLTTEVNPLFDRLRERLGEFNPEDEANMLASESGEDILSFMFESEVERCLSELEASVLDATTSTLYDDTIVTAEELEGLAQMLELPALANLCASVLAHIKAQPHQSRAIADLALAAWRRTQAMVLIGQTANFPTEIELPGSGIPSTSAVIEELPEWSNIDLNDRESDRTLEQLDLNDFTLVAGDAWNEDRSLTIADFGGENFDREHAMPFGEHASAKDLQALDPLNDFSPENAQPFSTITASDELEEIALITKDDLGERTLISTESEIDWIHLQTTISPEDELEEATPISTANEIDPSQLQTPIETEPGETIDAFKRLDLSGDLLGEDIDLASTIAAEFVDRLDLSGDLAFDTDAPDLLSDLSGFLAQVAPEEVSSAALNSSAIFNIASSSKQNALAQEAADLLSALDNVPEVPGETARDLEQQQAAANSPATKQVSEQTIRVATKQLAEIGDLFGELTIDRNGLNLHLQGLRQLVASLHLKVQQLEQSNTRLRSAYENTPSNQQPVEIATTDTWEQTHNTLSSQFTNQLDLLEFDRYSETHILAQEVVDTIVQIEELTTDLDLQLNDTERTTRDLNRTAKQLQTGLSQVRMRPISELFNRFPRAIRNLSVQHSKPIELKLKGGSTSIDRSILESLNDPLMHLLRNAFDHGIEPTAVRRANGKPDMGTIEIAASYRGNKTIITIKDDGGGIDLDKIRAKVRKMGIGETEIANFKDSELIELIFEPGFSTAAKVTDLSGRGVGMDVVRTNIRALNGDIFVETTLGQGSTFTITVPFTLSIVRVLLVESNGLWLAIPSNIVEEIILLNTAQIITTAGQKMLQWEGLTMRLIQPGQYLNMPYLGSQLATDNLPIIDSPTVLTIDQGQDIVALAIDKFWGEQEVTVRQPQGNLKLPQGFTGCTILGDGRIVPLVDAIEFIRWIDGDYAVTKAIEPDRHIFDNIDGETNNATPSAVAPLPRSRILVVDDSINVRRFVALTLEKAGYLVEQAKDGQEAVEKLQAGLSVQAVVCDIEMPRMDGYGFLATVKGHTQFKHIPVLMLTSRSGDKHRKIAMNLGANGYFAKPFKEQELLATLTQFLTRG